MCWIILKEITISDLHAVVQWISKHISLMVFKLNNSSSAFVTTATGLFEAKGTNAVQSAHTPISELIARILQRHLTIQQYNKIKLEYCRQWLPSVHSQMSVLYMNIDMKTLIIFRNLTIIYQLFWSFELYSMIYLTFL